MEAKIAQKRRFFIKNSEKNAKIMKFLHNRNSTQAKKRPEPKIISSGLLAGAAGFEPTNDGVRGKLLFQKSASFCPILAQKPLFFALFQKLFPHFSPI